MFFHLPMCVPHFNFLAHSSAELLSKTKKMDQQTNKHIYPKSITESLFIRNSTYVNYSCPELLVLGWTQKMDKQTSPTLFTHNPKVMQIWIYVRKGRLLCCKLYISGHQLCILGKRFWNSNDTLMLALYLPLHLKVDRISSLNLLQVDRVSTFMTVQVDTVSTCTVTTVKVNTVSTL